MKTTMKAVVRQKFGGPEVLQIDQVPVPEADPGHVVIRVKAFGLNHAETYMRTGAWGDVAKISGIECVGEVHQDGDSRLPPGRRVVAIMGGMGRTINGSYEEYVRVPASNVVPIDTKLPWEDLAALPESYATAWTCVHQQLRLARGQHFLVRGGTSALGQAAINLARDAGVHVLATTRRRERFALLEALGAQPLLETPALSAELRRTFADGIDAVLELVGNSTLIDSLSAVRLRGRVCLAGFLGGLGPVADFNPLVQHPSGVDLSFFGSFAFGLPAFPLSEVPLQHMVERAEAGAYQRTKPARVFRFEDIVEAHQAMDSGAAGGKLVVRIGS